jgi:hypothetical protein
VPISKEDQEVFDIHCTVLVDIGTTVNERSSPPNGSCLGRHISSANRIEWQGEQNRYGESKSLLLAGVS